MITASSDSSIVAASVTLYRMLLNIYPTRFRQEYGPQKLQLFLDRSRRAYGSHRLIWLWTITLIDLLKTMVDEHLHREIVMTQTTFIRWSGWALAGGGIAFALALIAGMLDPQWEDPLGGKDALIEYTQLGLIIVSHLLFLIGLIGIQQRHGVKVGQLGKSALMLGIVGAGAAFTGATLLEIIQGDWAWSAWVAGLMLMTSSLVVYGIAAARKQVMKRWNWSPIMAGLWPPLLFLIQFFGLEAISSQVPEFGDWVFLASSFLSMIGFIFLGLALQGDPVVEAAPA